MDKSSLISLLTIISFCVLFVSPGAARLSASGVLFEGDAPPTGHLSHDLVMSLSSDETSPLNLTVNVLDWYQDPSGANIGVKENPPMEAFSAKKILSISPTNFSIRPGASQIIKIEGDMPAGDGGRYAIVTVKTVPNAGKGAQGVAISVGMYAPVVLTISGSKLIKTGEIDNLTLQEPISPKQQNISMAFKNTGNYHYPVNASVTLRDGKGSVLATASTTTRGSIIPTAIRTIKISTVPKSALKPGAYTAEVNVKLKDGPLLATKKTQFEVKS